MAKYWLCHMDGLIEGCFSSPAEARDYVCELVVMDDWGASAFELNILETADRYEPNTDVLDFAAIEADWLALSNGKIERVSRKGALSS